MISFENVKKSYGHVTALDGLTMHVEDGALYALVGPNGAGKTTALRMLLGLVYPDSGQVLIDDMEAGADVPHRICAGSHRCLPEPSCIRVYGLFCGLL